MKISLDQAVNYDSIWLSPHPDDVVWSAGGHVASERRAGRRVLVVTLCTASPKDGASRQHLHAPMGRRGPDAMLVRLQEDANALGRLDVDYAHGGWLDAPDRLPQEYASLQRLTSGEPADSDDLPDVVYQALRAIRRSNPGATLHAPLGVGGHVDHVAVAHAAAQVEGTHFYEDVPYCLGDPGGEEARRRAPTNVEPELIDVTEVFPARIAASACYRSQVRLLFGGPSTLLVRLHRYARAIAPPGRLAERSWRPPAE
jgi:LmbE family N-acetylglucosaminyl deacetylase